MKYKTQRTKYKGKNHPRYIDGRTLKIYYCIDCGKKITSYQHRRCGSCASKYRLKDSTNHPFFGKKRPKLSKKMKGHIISQKTKLKISKSHQGKKASIETKRKMSIAKQGKNAPMYGRPTPNGKRIRYKGISMRSSWETKFAQFLELSNIKWEYEPKRFYFKDCTYCPDFYIPEWDLYVEIKGWWRRKARKKFNLFKKKYPKIKIKVLMRKELKELGIL